MCSSDLSREIQDHKTSKVKGRNSSKLNADVIARPFKTSLDKRALPEPYRLLTEKYAVAMGSKEIVHDTCLLSYLAKELVSRIV